MTVLGHSRCFASCHGYLGWATTLSTVDEISADLTAYVTGEIWIVVNEAPGSVIVEGRLWRCLFDLNCFAPTFGEG